VDVAERRESGWAKADRKEGGKRGTSLDLLKASSKQKKKGSGLVEVYCREIEKKKKGRGGAAIAACVGYF